MTSRCKDFCTRRHCSCYFAEKEIINPIQHSYFFITVRLRSQDQYITFSKILLMSSSITLNPSRMRQGGGSFYKIIIIYYPMTFTLCHQVPGAWRVHVLIDLTMASKYCTLYTPTSSESGKSVTRQSWNNRC